MSNYGLMTVFVDLQRHALGTTKLILDKNPHTADALPAARLQVTRSSLNSAAFDRRT
jgi:hypothetical protein